MAVTYYRKEKVYQPIIDCDSIDFKHRSLQEVGQLRYGRRGINNYYAMIALYDHDLLEYHKKEHLSVKGNSYADVIADLYDLVFNN